MRNLDKAFLNFFRRVSLKKAGKFTGKVGFPKFKSKKRGLGSFRLTGSIRINASRIKLPRLGWLRLKESGYLPVEGVVSTHRTLDGGKILSATVSERAGRWFVSVQVEQEVASVRCTTPSTERAQGEPCGVDLGIKSLAVCSDGREFENPKAFSKTFAMLRRTQRELGRRKKGGKNREKSRQKVARLHYRIANIRSDAIHALCVVLITASISRCVDEHKAQT